MDKAEANTQSSSKVNKKLLLKQALQLGPMTWRGAAISLLLCTLILYFATFFSGGVYSFLNGLVNLAFAIVLAFLSLSLGSLMVKVFGLIQNIQQPYRWVLFGSLFLLITLMVASVRSIGNALAIAIYLVITASLLGAGLSAWKTARQDGRPKKVPLLFSIIGGLGLCVLLIWFIWPGPVSTETESFSDQGTPAPTALENPAKQGPYNVLQLNYGSGTDKHRSEYGEDTDIITDTADLTSMVNLPMAPVNWLRNTYWGFGLDEAPLNARTWYPEGDGPFPLVLIVHGNHIMDHFSDPGYDYLGELLASRGYIIVSVDQNFLNGSGFIEGILGGLSNENDARGYLLLKHLALWHNWNKTTGHLFEEMVDTDNIALIGHSRGGEAAAIAAAFNHLPFHPDNGDLQFDFGYSIQSVIAIAPSDEQFKPRKRSTELRDINYLVLQGSADSDVRSFQGAMQYDRVSFTEDIGHFKAAAYIHGANHGQFNTVWGRIDQAFSRFFLDRRNIIPVDDQELAAKVFISSFIETTLQGHHEYQQLFAEPLWGQNWLPDIGYHMQYRDSSTKIIADFEEDMNLTTLSIDGGKAYGENFVTWREEPVTLGHGRLRDTISLRLGWNYESCGEAVYTLTLPEKFNENINATALTFAAANISVNREPVDFNIVLKDQAGEQAALPLSHISALPPSPQYQMFKKPLAVEFLSEPVFATYSFKISDFKAVNRAFNPLEILEIRFVFTSAAGTVYLDDVGFRP